MSHWEVPLWHTLQQQLVTDLSTHFSLTHTPADLSWHNTHPYFLHIQCESQAPFHSDVTFNISHLLTRNNWVIFRCDRLKTSKWLPPFFFINPLIPSVCTVLHICSWPTSAEDIRQDFRDLHRHFWANIASSNDAAKIMIVFSKFFWTLHSPVRKLNKHGIK